MQPKSVIAGFVAAHHCWHRSQFAPRPRAGAVDQCQQTSMIAAVELMTGNPIPLGTVHRHQPAPPAQFDCNENRATMADGGRANSRCLHLNSPMVRVRKPKPIGGTLTAP